MGDELGSESGCSARRLDASSIIGPAFSVGRTSFRRRVGVGVNLSCTGAHLLGVEEAGAGVEDGLSAMAELTGGSSSIMPSWSKLSGMASITA